MGWVQDQEGDLSEDPYELKKGGSMRPLGGDREHGSHKGYILGSVVDIFSAVLSGANYGPWVPPFPSFLEVPTNPVGDGIGHFAGAMRVDAFRPADEFKKDMDNWIRRFRSSQTVKGQEKVLIPGDPEREMTQIRQKEGIPLLDAVGTDLQGLAERFRIEFPKS